MNITRAGKDLIQYELKVDFALNIKFFAIEFEVTLPKHHEGIGAVECVIEVIKNTVSKSTTGPNQVKMSNEELLTWLSLVIQKVNDHLLSLGAPLGITLTPNHILHGFRNTHGDEINPETSVQSQLTWWQVALLMFRSLLTQEFANRNYLLFGKNKVKVLTWVMLFCSETNLATSINSPPPES